MKHQNDNFLRLQLLDSVNIKKKIHHATLMTDLRIVLNHYFTWYLKLCLLYNQQMSKLKNLKKNGSNFLSELKILQLKVKLLVLSNITFYCNVFKHCIEQQAVMSSMWSDGLKIILRIISMLLDLTVISRRAEARDLYFNSFSEMTWEESY